MNETAAQIPPADGAAACSPPSGPCGADVDVAAGLLQLATRVQVIYTIVSERYELTSVQAKLLCVLLDGPRGMAELAHCFDVEKAALTGLMNRVERRGLAERGPVPGDRRAVQVTLTDAGREAALAFHTDVGAELAHLTAHLAPAEKDHFAATMAGILERCRGGHAEA
ncbi:DNA-binding MarR family transcriptional regulator [Actinocorallia herbida]|uniref:DNA-binding MarR family transcriptional regulator n=1 Tax=Actinocorallia herbida TaxID=58109 RepID=A0A3N1D3N2_9ACTN|nr:MarR family winged helix-turn-helix transcriptional regulator [Actinocorallia herbida]ROO88132.1 DNA-binding MarR family transcriptional regulator [Actinocorallia herbida]